MPADRFGSTHWCSGARANLCRSWTNCSHGVIDQLRGSVGRDLLERRLVHANSGEHKQLHTELAIAGDLVGARRHLKHRLDAVCSAMIDEID